MLAEPAPLACFGSARSVDPLVFHILKQYLLELDITPKNLCICWSLTSRWNVIIVLSVMSLNASHVAGFVLGGL